MYNRPKVLTPEQVVRRVQNRPLEYTAYHEAGHAVIAYRLGYGTKKVTIVPNRGTRGSWAGTTLPDNWSVDAIKIDMAGALGEDLVNPVPFNEHIQLGAGHDWRNTRRSVREMVGFGFISYQDRDGLVDELMHDTRALVQRDKEAIARVAEALLERKTLTGDDIRMIMEQCDDPHRH
jgi:ATP-dependent Zn protease